MTGSTMHVLYLLSVWVQEKVLLPAVREVRGGTRLDRAHELRIDHAALTSLLVPTPDLALCQEILALLSEHDAKEEGRDGVYEECRRAVSDRDLTRLARRAESFPQVRVARHFDGPSVHRTAQEALASARRMRAPRNVEGR